MTYKLLMPELTNILILFCRRVLEHGIIYPIMQSSESKNSFKCFLQRGKTTVPKHYYAGCIKGQILLTRLRTNCSSLNFDLFVKNISDSPLCHCGTIENAQHFFFHCTSYQEQRNELINAVSPYQQPSLKLFLYADLSLSYETNT